MLKASVDLDLFGIVNQNAAKFHSMEQKNSFRGIQGAISRLNPELLRNVIASGAGTARTDPRSPEGARQAVAPMLLPVLNPGFSAVSSPGTAPMTIFYNGTVAVFDVPSYKAKSIMEMAEKGNSGAAVDRSGPARSGQADGLLENFNGELLPIARKKSLQRFLEKRKERYVMKTPQLLVTRSHHSRYAYLLPFLYYENRRS